MFNNLAFHQFHPLTMQEYIAKYSLRKRLYISFEQRINEKT